MTTTRKRAQPTAATTASKRKKTTDQPSAVNAEESGAVAKLREMEEDYRKKGYKHVAGVDEAGRGPLAGPVVAAACVIPAHVRIEGINDSKQLTAEVRDSLYDEITQNPDIHWAACVKEHTRIDEINILQATMEAMAESVRDIKGVTADLVLVDGPRVPKQLGEAGVEAVPVVKGDAKCLCIAAASIIAKVTRDRIMVAHDASFPEYGFAQHMGYGVPQHVAAIHRHGPCAIHRRTFAPVKHMVSPPPSCRPDKSNGRPRKGGQGEKAGNSRAKTAPAAKAKPAKAKAAPRTPPAKAKAAPAKTSTAAKGKAKRSADPEKTTTPKRQGKTTQSPRIGRGGKK